MWILLNPGVKWLENEKKKKRHLGGRDWDSRIGEDDACPAGILNREFCFTVLTSDTPNSSGEVIALESLDVFDLEGIEV